MVALISKLLDVILAIFDQISLEEQTDSNPENLYNADTKKIDAAIGNHDIAANDSIIDDLLMH